MKKSSDVPKKSTTFHSLQRITGWMLIMIGGFFLLNTLTGYAFIRLWPIIFVAAGLIIIFGRVGSKS